MNYSIVIGTNRMDSNSAKISVYYQQIFKEKKIDAELIDLKTLPQDFLFSDMFGKRTEQFQEFQNQINKTNKFIFVIPEYNGSFPGILKSFIDSCEFPNSFAGKKACLVGLSAGQFGNVRGLEHFTGVANYIKMNVCHNKVYLPAIHKDIKEDGILNNPNLVNLINQQIEEFIAF